MTKCKDSSSFDGGGRCSHNKKKGLCFKTTEKVEDSVNKPRNLLVTDATTPVQVAWTGRFRLQHNVTVKQTADQETWPGGALWDMGWCLAQLLIGLAASPTVGGQVQAASSTTTHLGKSLIRTVQVPMRVSQAVQHHYLRLFTTGTSCGARPLIILELGCGVGLSGLVAAAALQAKAVILTDLQIVIDKVTQPNVLINTTMENKKATKKTTTNNKKINLASPNAVVTPALAVRMMMKNAVNTQVLAMPLCWGNQNDEQAVQAVLENIAMHHQQHHHHHQQQQSSSNGNTRTRKKKGSTTHSPSPMGSPMQEDEVENNRCSNSRQQNKTAGIGISSMPDLILIGDVAFQQAPGAPSHFDALVSTLLKFVDMDKTLVMFGTRIRMPASVDLLEMLLVHLEPVPGVEQPIMADEIEPLAFANVKHNMSIHLLRKRRKQQQE